MRIGILAGEPSGDRLAAGLIEAIRRREPGVRFYGMAGPRMVAAGCEQRFSIDQLSVVGFVEVLRQYLRLRRLREDVVRCFLDDPPDVFIGVDVPDFVLEVEARLRTAGIRSAHLVSPTVWAWRPGRVATVAGAVDLTPQLELTLRTGASRELLCAADAALITSGTTTVEALLAKCPSVVAYRMSWASYGIARLLVRTPYIAMANIIAGRTLFPEFVQGAMQPAPMARALRGWLDDAERVRELRASCTVLHAEMRRGAADRAAEAVLALATQGKGNR
ncbi:MAG: hypothetical protein P8Y76_08870 [bacterium]